MYPSLNLRIRYITIYLISRTNLFTTWSLHLEAANIAYRPDLARTEFLSDPDERLGWQSKSLPTGSIFNTYLSSR